MSIKELSDYINSHYPPGIPLPQKQYNKSVKQ